MSKVYRDREMRENLPAAAADSRAAQGRRRRSGAMVVQAGNLDSQALLRRRYLGDPKKGLQGRTAHSEGRVMRRKAGGGGNH